MPSRKNWIKLLIDQSKKDNATNLKVNNIDIANCKNLSINRNSKCDFICDCGEKSIKNCQPIQKTGFYCKYCTNNKRKNWVKLLIDQSKKDNATNLKVNNIDIVDCKNLSGEKSKCDFICNCGEKSIKNCRPIQKTGFYCKYCTNKRKKEKTKAIWLKKYGVEHPLQSEEIKDKRKKNNLKKYGVENPTQLQEVRDKMKKTMLERHGVENPSQSREIKNKKVETCLKNFGVEYPFQSEEVRDKMKKTMLERHGVENPSQSREIKNKKVETCLKNFGVEYPFQSEEVRDKRKKNNLKKYGVENPTQLQEVRDKMKKTMLERHGVEYPMQSEEIRNTRKKNNLKKYGVENPTQLQEVRDKMKKTMLERHGVEHPLQSEEIKDKKVETCLKNFGVEYPMQIKEIFDRQQRSGFKQKKYTFKTCETITCQGYEPLTIECLENKYNFTYKDYINWDGLEFWYEQYGKKHRYYPDIPFLRKNKIIEVKSNWTFNLQLCKNLLKSKCVIQKGFDFEFWVYDKNYDLQIINTELIKNNIEINNEILSFVING